MHYALLDIVFCLDFNPFFFFSFVPLLNVFSLFIYLKFNKQASCYIDSQLIIRWVSYDEKIATIHVNVDEY